MESVERGVRREITRVRNDGVESVERWERERVFKHEKE